MKRLAGTLVVVLLLVAAGVGWWWTHRRDGATWDVMPGQSVDAATTRLQVRVSPTGCTSGRVDDLQGPAVDVRPDRVVVTYTVAALRGLPGQAESCPGVLVPATLVLPEPLGHRRLVDGTCPAYERTDGRTECVRAPAP